MSWYLQPLGVWFILTGIISVIGFTTMIYLSTKEEKIPVVEEQGQPAQ